MTLLQSPFLGSDLQLRQAAAGGVPLRLGEQSSGVAQFQAALLDLGYGGGAAPGSGTFDEPTAGLVRTFQRDTGLGQTGVLDQATLLAADRALVAQASVPIAHGRGARNTVVPPPQPVRDGRSPIGPSTPHPLTFQDDYYEIGTADPFLQPDPGSGPWRSKPVTWSARAAQQAARAALFHRAGVAVGWHANEHLLHYFQNSGLDYWIDLEGMIRAVPRARNLFTFCYQTAQDFVMHLPNGTYDFTMSHARGGDCPLSESQDWYFATNMYSAWGKGRAHVVGVGMTRQYRMDFNYRFYDRYNWDAGKFVWLGPLKIEDRMLAEFHLQGLAKEFNCYGSIWRRFQWTGDYTPSAQEIVTHGGR